MLAVAEWLSTHAGGSVTRRTWFSGAPPVYVYQTTSPTDQTPSTIRTPSLPAMPGLNTIIMY